VTNAKCRDMLIGLLNIADDKFITIEDGQTMSLGDKTMQFVFIPWVHWPETMATYLKEDRIFFPCDFFGSHLASSSLFVEDQPTVYEAAKRYYAEIMMPFRLAIRKNLEKMKSLDIDMIATSHGPVYAQPAFIVEAYTDWASDTVKNEVVIPYISMHGSTGKMVEHFVDALIERKITVRQFDMSATDIGKLAMALVDAATLVVASPTFLAAAHPSVCYACSLANALRPKTRFASVIGSFGWASRTVETLTALIPNLKVELLTPVIAKGLPKDEDFAALDKLADQILAKHKEIKITD
jgi:flavorubredoxin